MEIAMKKFMFPLAVICAMFFFVSCGGSGSETKDGETQEPEETVNDSEPADTDSEETADSGSDEPEELAYPEVTPMSNESGLIAQNITIYDDKDVKHQLAEWYKPNNPSSKLVWLIFTTYDCPYCQILEEDLLEINKREYRDQGFKIILVFNGYLYDGPKPDEEPETLLEYKDTYLAMYPDTANFELYGYLKNEEQKVLKRFMGLRGGYPTHLLLDASTMEILDYAAGWSDDMVTSTCDEIEMLLEML